LAKAGVTGRDVVVGIAASGTTRYVLGGVEWAKRRGCVTVAVTSNPRSPLARMARIAITPETGQEAIAGSTRMKAGTAQKMVLNMLSTTAMVRLGRVYENWMIYVALTNQKLHRRGARILTEAAGVTASAAKHALRQAGHDLPAALVMLKTGANAVAARRSLRRSGGNARMALELHPKRRAISKGQGK
jgi:N-acetylmuramic acid 6-phosphate etherase